MKNSTENSLFGAIFLCLRSYILRALTLIPWEAIQHLDRGKRRARIERLQENKLFMSRKQIYNHIYRYFPSTPKAIALQISPRSQPKGARPTHRTTVILWVINERQRVDARAKQSVRKEAARRNQSKEAVDAAREREMSTETVRRRR